MKKIIRIISGLSLLFLASTSQQASAQDISINMLTLAPTNVHVGDTSYIQMDVCNEDANPVTAPANKIRTLVSTSGVVTIIKACSDVQGTPLPTSQWSLLSLTAGSGNSIRLQYVPTMLNGDCSTFYIQIVATNNGTGNFTSTLQWNGPQTVGNITTNDNSTTGITVSQPLPVSFSAFTARKQECAAQLDWTTAMEHNNAYFNVERSIDGVSFTKIAQVAATGNSSTEQHYSYTDRKPETGRNSYRITQVDLDNKKTSTGVQSLEFDCSKGIVKVYPTVTSSTLNVELPAGYDNTDVKVFSVVGQLIDVPGAGKMNSGLHTLQLGNVAKGSYMVRVANGSNVQTFKVIYQ
jgi:hypothetical protein